MTWLIPWIALSLSLFWHYPTLQLVGCNSCLTNINFRHFGGISAHESLTKPVEPLPFCVWWIITWNPWTVAKFLLLMLFHVCCNIRLRIRFRIHIHHHRFWSTPSTRMSLCNCRWFLHCHGRERESASYQRYQLLWNLYLYPHMFRLLYLHLYMYLYLYLYRHLRLSVKKGVCSDARASLFMNILYICPGAQGTG